MTDQNGQVRQLIAELLQVIQQEPFLSGDDTSLLNGLAGRLLFQWYAGKAAIEGFSLELLESQVGTLIDEATQNNACMSFGYGLSGIFWFIELLLQEREEAYSSVLGQSFESGLVRFLKSSKSWNGEIEFVLGLAGIAVYAARRAKKNGEVLLCQQLLKMFDKKSLYIGSDLRTWRQPAGSMYYKNNVKNSHPEINLGLAHGVPGIISAVMALALNSCTASDAKQIVQQSCDWLLLQPPLQQSDSMYPAYCGELTSSRLGWCYGDATIALTLARAGIMLGKTNYIEHAVNVIRHASQRNLVSSQVVDAGLCHGSSGLMLIFHLFNKHINQQCCVKASQFWLRDTLSRYQNYGLAGLNAMKHGKYDKDLSFLSGYAGIGLALLAILGEETNWVDSILLG